MSQEKPGGARRSQEGEPHLQSTYLGSLSGLVYSGFGKEPPPLNILGICFWSPNPRNIFRDEGFMSKPIRGRRTRSIAKSPPK